MAVYTGCDMVVCSVWHTVWPKSVGDVAVPAMRLCECVCVRLGVTWFKGNERPKQLRALREKTLFSCTLYLELSGHQGV